MNLTQFKKLKIPDTPGVYSFIKDGQALYIGKATSLKDRLRSYFNPDLIDTRGRRIVNMVAVADKIEFEKADSVLEAFIRETELIKKYQPITNSLAKDNKSFNFVVITDEDFPRVLVERGRNIEMTAVDFKAKYIFGPYPYGSELREAMKILRRIFPYRDTCLPATVQDLKSGLMSGRKSDPKSTLAATGQSLRPCFNRSIGLCPGVCTGEISRKDYLKIINNIRLFFQGKKSKVVANLKKQMNTYAKNHQFELAGETKRTLYAIEHIKDISMMKRDSDGGKFIANTAKDEIDGQNGQSKLRRLLSPDWQGEVAEKRIRVESYDIAHMAGRDMVGVMCVMNDNQLDKSQYRKFIIKGFDRSNDTGALREIINRRLGHAEWPLPDIIIVDGGHAQLQSALSTVNNFFKQQSFEFPEKYTEEFLQSEIPIVISVVKNDSHQAREVLYSDTNEIFIKNTKNIRQEVSKLISQEKIFELNAETHRFAITFHKKKRDDNFLPRKK